MNQQVDITPDARRANAIHEAGHAVAAVHLGIPVSVVTIVPTAHYMGITIYTRDHVKKVMWALDGSFPPDDEADEERMDTEEPPHALAVIADAAVASLAGRMAEEVILGRVRDAGMYVHDESGLTEMTMREGMEGEEAEAFVAWATIRARRFVRLWRKQIEAVADALLAHDTLDEDGVRRAMYPPRKVAGRQPAT